MNTAMRDFPAKTIAFPAITIKGPGPKYLSQSSSTDIGLQAVPDKIARSPKLSRQVKSLSLDEADWLSASVIPPKSPRLRRLKFAHQSASLDGDQFMAKIEPPMNRSRSPRPPGERAGPISSLSIKVSQSSDDLLSSETEYPSLRSRSPRLGLLAQGGQGFKSVSSDNYLAPEVSGSPPKTSGASSPRLSPTPPRTPRDGTRSRSRSPYRHTGINSSVVQPNSLSRQDSEELAPWDFPNSLRSHPPPKSPKPRRLAPVKSLSESSEDSADLLQQTSTSSGSLKSVTDSSEHVLPKVKHGDNLQDDEEREGIADEFSEDEFDPYHFLPICRPELPDSSDIFQQTLEALRNKGSRSSSRSSSARSSVTADPGDLHISRSSLVISQLSDHLDAENDTTQDELDTLDEDKEVIAFKARKSWATAISTVIDVVEPRMMRRKTMHGVQDTTFQNQKHDPKKRIGTLGEAVLLLTRSSEARRKVSDVSEPPTRSAVISLKTAFQLTKFITAASASNSVGGNKNQTAHLISKGVSKLPQICNNGRMMQRQRQDSLRLARYMVEEQSALGDATEVASFIDLRDCRYLRTRPSPRSLGRKSSLLGFNEV